MTNVTEHASGPWVRGMNSAYDPTHLPENQVQYSTNTTCRGGVYATRPGYVKLLNPRPRNPGTLFPRGLTVFQPLNKEPTLVLVLGGVVYTLPWPFTGEWILLTELWAEDPSDNPVFFEVAMKGVTLNADGTLTIIDPYPVLIIQSGHAQAIYWDGKIASTLNPANNQTPVGTWMKWIGNRLWVATGNKLRVSNILDPFTFTEEDIAAEGGFFTLPDECTGLGVTADQKSLIAFTSTTATAFQAGIRNRTAWASTPDFQKLLFPNIGCVAGNTIVSQYGILWWLSQGGLMRLDTALQSYISSKVRYLDNNMARSKGNFSKDLSRACAGWFENFLAISAPSGDIYNAHTWIMDQSAEELIDESSNPVWASVWTGTRPCQWVTANIRGQSRCFFLSYDKPSTNSGLRFDYGIWEAFTGIKKDISDLYSGHVKDIACSVEFRYTGYSEEWKNYAYAVLELTELSGLVHLEVFYASRHSGYKQILSKNIVATANSLMINVPITNVDTYIRQARTITAYEDESESTDSDSGVESKMTRNSDKAFSLLVKWTGCCSISRMKLCTTPDQYHVETEEDETTQRYVKPDGSGEILDVFPIEGSLIHGITSSNLLPVSQRWEEDDYNSRIY